MSEPRAPCNVIAPAVQCPPRTDAAITAPPTEPTPAQLQACAALGLTPAQAGALLARAIVADLAALEAELTARQKDAA